MLINRKKYTVFQILKTAIVFIVIALTSCIPQKKLILMQYEDLIDSTYAETFSGTHFEDTVYRLQPNDYLYINITAVDKKITGFFEPVAGINYLNSENQALVGYYINSDGTIDFPYIGQIYLSGLSLRQAVDTIRAKAKDYVQIARIEFKLINNSINVIGEVHKEGIYNMTRNQLSIYEAITLAGGFSDFAKRDKVKVLRNEKGKYKIYVIDTTSGKLIGKRMFYVYPNDIVYVEPMKAKSIGITPTFSLSVISTIITTYILILSLSK